MSPVMFRSNQPALSLHPFLLFKIFLLSVCRTERKEEQLMAAQAYLKLGEVGAESGRMQKVEILQQI